MPRFKIKEIVVIKARGRFRGFGRIKRPFPLGIRSRLYVVSLESNAYGLHNVFALDNKFCCKYRNDRHSNQIYKFEEAYA